MSMEMTEQLEVNPDMPKIDMAAALGEALEFDKELAPFTTFKTGGKADFFIAAKSEDEVVNTISICEKNNIPVFILGGGSNLLISDDGFRGLVLKIAINGIQHNENSEIICGAGEDLMALVNYSAEHGLTGLEFASGIFGSVGGAVCGNAGAYGGEIKDLLKEISIVDRGGALKKVTPEYCRFGYRDSYLKETGDIVLSISLQLSVGDKEVIKQKIDEILQIRSGKHPVNGMSAGSFFKNIPDEKEKHGKLPAGRLLEDIGAKTMSVGGAKVYENHANIIINDGKASSKDIRELADMLKEKVFDKFGITLEEEVISVGKF